MVSPDERHRRTETSTGCGSPASFERLLDQLLQALHGGVGHQEGVGAALDLIATYFSAERAVLTVPGWTASAPGEPAAPEPDLQQEILWAPGGSAGAVALFGSDRAACWSDRDALQLRIAAQTVGEALRRTKAESELREQQIWLLMAMEAATVGVWDWHVATDRVRYLSLVDDHGDGLQVQETEVTHTYARNHPDDLEVIRADVERALSGETDGFAIVVRQREGREPDVRWRHLYSRGRVVERDPTGRARRVMGTYEDVTEAQLKAGAEKEREAAMARAARMASLGALASSLAHDLNQPLTALTSFLEGTARLISKGAATDAEVVEALERSVSFAYRASDILRRFRQLLRREAPLRDPIDLVSLLGRVRDHQRRDAVAAGVEIVVPEGLDPVIARGDVLQIEQLVINLVRNAIEALGGADRSPRVVTLDARSVGGTCELRVSDNGPGVPSDVLDRLFEPRAAGAEAGRGLGLMICHSIAEIHGGRLDVERTGPDGTTFVLALPRGDGGPR